MPLLTTRGAASARGFGLFAALPADNWIGRLGASTGSPLGYNICTDSSANIYVCSSFSGNPVVSKYSASGQIQWQKTVTGAGTPGLPSIVCDSSGNIYVAGYTPAVVALVMKFDPSGTVLWQRELNAGSYNSVSVDSSGNVYLCGYNSPGFLVTKYNGSGTLQWQKALSGPSGTLSAGQGVATDSSGNLYVCGYSDQTSPYGAVLAKYSTSGTLLWQKRLSGGTAAYSYSVSVSPDGYVYIGGNFSPVGLPAEALIAKYDSSGNLQWQRAFGGNATVDNFGYVFAASDGVYASGSYKPVSSGLYRQLIVKYSSSGDLQWQRYILTATQSFGRGVSSAVGSSFLYTGYDSTSVVIAKLPSNGDGQGTYDVGGVTTTYGDPGLTGSTSTLTSSAGALTDSTPTLTSSTATQTASISTQPWAYTEV